MVRIVSHEREVIYGDIIQLLENLINNVDLFDKKTIHLKKKNLLQNLNAFLKKNECSFQNINKIIELTQGMTQTHDSYKPPFEEHKSFISKFVLSPENKNLYQDLTIADIENFLSENKIK